MRTFWSTNPGKNSSWGNSSPCDLKTFSPPPQLNSRSETLLLHCYPKKRNHLCLSGVLKMHMLIKNAQALTQQFHRRTYPQAIVNDRYAHLIAVRMLKTMLFKITKSFHFQYYQQLFLRWMEAGQVLVLSFSWTLYKYLKIILSYKIF